MRSPPEPGDVVVRPYAVGDRARVRWICHQTGYMGDPAGWMWRDQESFSALFCDWWIDHQPTSALVAELDGVVAGYLLGCEDSRQVREGSAFVKQFVGRGCCLRPGTAPMMWRMLADAAVLGARKQLPVRVWDRRWPAHLHINLLPECRGRGAGARLMRTWLDSLKAQAVPGCHLQTTLENTRAVRFFESAGFEKHGPATPEPGFRSPDGKRLHIQLMVQPFVT